MKDVQYLSCEESRGRAIIANVAPVVSRAKVDQRNPTILLGEAVELLRLAEIGIEAERLYNALRTRDDA